MAYRNDVDALAARHAALEAEVAKLARERDDAAQLLAEARAAEEAEHKRQVRAARAPARHTLAWVLAGLATMTIGVLAGLSIRHHRLHDLRVERALVQFSEFSDEMCACKSPECAQRVSDDMTKWGTEISRDWSDMPKLDDAAMAQRDQPRQAHERLHDESDGGQRTAVSSWSHT